MEWNNVSDCLPAEGDFVLVAWVPADKPMPEVYHHFYGLADYTDERGWDFVDGKNIHKIWGKVKVLAWADLPPEYEG